MTSVARLYAVAAAVLVLFLFWAFAAARPWGDPPADARIATLAAREQRLRSESARVQRLVDRRWLVYRARLAERRLAIADVTRQNAQAAAAAAAAVRSPVVRLAPLAPVTATRSS